MDISRKATNPDDDKPFTFADYLHPFLDRLAELGKTIQLTQESQQYHGMHLNNLESRIGSVEQRAHENRLRLDSTDSKVDFALKDIDNQLAGLRQGITKVTERVSQDIREHISGHLHDLRANIDAQKATLAEQRVVVDVLHREGIKSRAYATLAYKLFGGAFVIAVSIITALVTSYFQKGGI